MQPAAYLRRCFMNKFFLPLPLYRLTGGFFILMLLPELSACSRPPRGDGILSSAKVIRGFVFAGLNAEGMIARTDILVVVPLGTNLTSLSPAITRTGKSISPASGVARDFTNPIPYTVTAADGSEASYIVTVIWESIEEYLNAAIAGYLTASPDEGTTADHPIPLHSPPVAISIPSDWAALLSMMQIAGKYVALDLSACTMSGMEFDPGNSIDTGKDKIVSLVIPDAAESITASTYPNSTFQHFAALKSVRGENITSIGDYAVIYCTTLTDLYLPATPPTRGVKMFEDAGTDTTLTIHIPGGAANYTAASPGWGVSVETADGNNTSVYGRNRKRIVITGAP
jgi:hypothetical protein